MLKAPSEFIIIFIAISLLLILGMAVFISTIIYRYQQKQNTYFKDIEALKSSHENALLQSQLEMQEQTFQHISREIHDNISQKLTLAKLHLNTINIANRPAEMQQLGETAIIISQAINDLSDLSRSMSSEILLNDGLIKALEYEVTQLSKTGLFTIGFSVTGNPVFMNADIELVVFRIIQEVLNNIVKHAAATSIKINLHYEQSILIMRINDDGKGFDTLAAKTGLGLQNIKKRTSLLNGKLTLKSHAGNGTEITIEIPFYENIHTN